MVDIISDLYKVKIIASQTQLQHTQQSIAISVEITDFNGNNITGKNIQMSTDNGAFLRDAGHNLGQNCTLTSGGTIGFTTDQTGITNIIAKINNIPKANLQIFTNSSYKKIQLTTTNAVQTTYLYVNEDTRKCILYYAYGNSGTTLQKNSTTAYGASVKIETNFIPSEYAPELPIYGSIYRPDVSLYISGRDLYYRVEENKTLGETMSNTFYWTY